MKDPSEQVRKAYWTKLSSYSIFDGQGSVSQDAVKPYIVLSIEPSKQTPNKDALIYEDFSVTLDIITDYKGQFEADKVGQEVLDIICPTQGQTSVVLPDFQIIATDYAFRNMEQITTPTGVIARKILTISHILIQ